MRVFDQINMSVLNAIEDVMDRFEDREFFPSEPTLMGGVIHNFEINGKKFAIRIQPVSE